MFTTIMKVLGGDKIIEKGLELIDDAWETDTEIRESKTKAKIDLMKAYAPFKIAQRYLALLFSFTFIFSFFLVLGCVLSGYGNVADIYDVLKAFYIGEIMLSIVIFYFGGGLTESVGRSLIKRKQKDNGDAEG